MEISEEESEEMKLIRIKLFLNEIKLEELTPRQKKLLKYNNFIIISNKEKMNKELNKKKEEKRKIKFDSTIKKKENIIDEKNIKTYLKNLE